MGEDRRQGDRRQADRRDPSVQDRRNLGGGVNNSKKAKPITISLQTFIIIIVAVVVVMLGVAYFIVNKNSEKDSDYVDDEIVYDEDLLEDEIDEVIIRE